MLIDSLKFSREQQSVCGVLPVAGFSRLRDSLFSVASDGAINYAVSGDADARNHPVLRLKVSGRLALQCQRCLKVLEYRLAIDTALRLVAEASLDAEASADPDEPDCIAASTELDLFALIEDEILLALPAYPRHEDRSCSGTKGVVSTKKVSAFSVLSNLGGLSAPKKAKDI